MLIAIITELPIINDAMLFKYEITVDGEIPILIFSLTKYFHPFLHAGQVCCRSHLDFLKLLSTTIASVVEPSKTTITNFTKVSSNLGFITVTIYYSKLLLYWHVEEENCLLSVKFNCKDQKNSSEHVPTRSNDLATKLHQGT